ncbi:unnamed protein product [marine sediment metagenome]|uniref:Uncharacterized protein n=2 Tax=marine sediment metagenome TaxID=412755 RepID=X1CC42_9ZZZZ
MPDIIDSLYEEHKEPEDESEIIVIPDLVDTCPVLHDFMRFTKFMGKPTEPPRLGYHVSEGKLYVSLSDGQRRRSLRIVAPTFYDGLREIENHITQGALATLWYNWPSRNGSKRKNGKAS